MAIGGFNLSGCPVNTRTGRCIVAASGRCVWDDLESLGLKPDVKNSLNGDVMCINDMIMHFPNKITHGYSNDWKMLHAWVAARRPRYKIRFQEDIKLHTCRMGRKGIQSWPFPGHGTSSLNALYTALALGYEEIIGVGMPMDGSGHYFDPPWVTTNFQNECSQETGQVRFWENAFRNTFNGRVRIVSGRLAKYSL